VKPAFHNKYYNGFTTEVLSTGAPRPTKMGTIVSPWRYDDAAETAITDDYARRLPRVHANIPVEAIERMAYYANGSLSE